MSSRNGRPTLRSTCTKLEKTSLSADAAEGPFKRYAATHKELPLIFVSVFKVREHGFAAVFAG